MTKAQANKIKVGSYFVYDRSIEKLHIIVLNDSNSDRVLIFFTNDYGGTTTWYDRDHLLSEKNTLIKE